MYQITRLRLNMNFDNLITENLVLNIVRDKFRHDENVISVSVIKKIIRQYKISSVI